MTQSEIIVRRKLSDEVQERLLKLIESGELAPGSEMPSERELMARYRVGRPAIREALQALEKMRLISIRHGERARVLSLTPRSMFEQINDVTRHLLATSPETVEHLKEARRMFEVGMVRRAAELANRRDLSQLQQALDDQRIFLDDPARFVAADIRFHNLLAQTSRNPICLAVSEAMLQWLFEFHKELLRVPGREQLALAEHQEIYERVAARDADGAAQAMIDHLNRASPPRRRRKPKNRAKTTPQPMPRATFGHHDHE